MTEEKQRVTGFLESSTPSKVLLADVSHLFWSHWFASDGLEVSEAFSRTIATFQQMRSGFDMVIACCDSPPYVRSQVLPGYKSSRPPKPPMALEQLDRVKKRIAADGFHVVELKGHEADDILATLATKLSGLGHEVALGSTDKDIAQMVCDERRISILHPLKGTTLRELDVVARYEVHPSSIADWLSLMGDRGDDIPGIPGVGPKNAAKLLAEFGTLEGVLTHYDDIPQPKLSANIREFAAAARLARKVVELRRDLPLDVDALLVPKQPETLPTRSYEVEEEVTFGTPAEPNGEAPAEPKADALATATPIGTHLATAPVQFEHGLEPSNMGAAWQLAKGVFQSRLYPQLSTAEAVWAIIIRGREMGLGALTALDTIVMIKGKPALSAHLIIARAKMHPECEFFQLVSSDDKAAEWVCKRKGNPEPTRMRYTIEQARQAGLKDGNWATRPAEMVRKTAGVHLARVEFPESAIGVFAIEELED